MRRRNFIAGLASVTTAWPVAARGQQSAVPVIGFLNGQTAASFAHLVAAFKQGLTENGFVEGQNVTIEYKWADRHFDQLPALATDLVARSPTVIVATGGAHHAAMAATETIPIVCSFGGDPVRLGLVASLNKPGRNVTGVSVLSADLEAKKLELLSEVVPRGAAIGYLIDPNFDGAPQQRQAVETAGQTIGRPVRIVEARGDGDLEKAFAALADEHVAGFVVGSNPLFNNTRDHVLALNTKLSIPGIFEVREFVRAGGLMSYGTNLPEVYREIGIYAARVLKGEKAGDLPVLEPTKFDMAVNLRTAKSLGIEMPTSILLRADEVIE